MKTVSNKHNELGKYFAQHLSAMTSDISPKEIDRLWQDIVMRYGEPQRAYHTLNHIEQLLVQFENIKHVLSEPHIIALVLYYHDVIYDPTRSDNELKSAELATDALSPYLSPEQCRQIHALIMMIRAATEMSLVSTSTPAVLVNASTIGKNDRVASAGASSVFV